MHSLANTRLSPFAEDVRSGLSALEKVIPPHYLYNEIGFGLFETMCMLPERGMAQAEERIFRRHSDEISRLVDSLSTVAELGSGCKGATAHLLRSILDRQPDVRERLEVATCSPNAAQHPLVPIHRVAPVCSDWLRKAAEILRGRANKPVLLTLLGSSAGTLDRAAFRSFLQEIRSMLKPGDYFLFAADLMKEVPRMLAGYDDAAGVTAAFNRNVLCRINRELAGRFDPLAFVHCARWNAFLRRIELYLISQREQQVYVGDLGCRLLFQQGEGIRTECAYKFSELELESLAELAGFQAVKSWRDSQWPFADVLWTV